MTYSSNANPNATNSELDSKSIITHKELTSTQRDELIEQYIDIVIDNMDTKTMIQVITDFMKDEYNDYSDEELKCQIEYTNDEELYEELVDNVTSQTNNQGGQF